MTAKQPTRVSRPGPELSPLLSPSEEADDERSWSSVSSGASIMDQLGGVRSPRYPGEDVRLTSRKELAGWYSYSWAAEVFVVCGMGSFLPITLEQLARERGVLLSDGITQCQPSSPISGPNGTFPSAGNSTSLHESPCVVPIFGVMVNTASFAMYTFSLSVLIQSLLIISMSGAADHGSHRKSLLLGFAFTGAIATMAFLPVVPKLYILGAILAIIANTCFGASFVLLNSFLPLLVRHHPSVDQRNPRYSPVATSPAASPLLAAHPAVDEGYASAFDDDGQIQRTPVDPTLAMFPTDPLDEPLLPHESPAAPSMELMLSTKISSNGIGIGYIAAVLVQSLSVFIVLMTGSSSFSLRLVLFIVGAWWFIFTIPSAFWLRARPGPPLDTKSKGKSLSWLSYLIFAWQALGKTILRARRLKDVMIFLAAWFLLSDGIATVSGTAVLFAKTSLGMKPAALALINVVVMISGVIGAFTWSTASRMMGLKPSQTILACLVVFEIIPIYALLGYLPAIQRFGSFGLQQPWEMYPLGAVYGLVMGGLSSYCRALFGELIPPGFEAAFFALYAITDKGSSVFGPAIVGAITDATGEIRPAFWFLAVLIGLPFPLMCFVDVERGRRQGAEMSRELEGDKVATGHSTRLSSES